MLRKKNKQTLQNYGESRKIKLGVMKTGEYNEKIVMTTMAETEGLWEHARANTCDTSKTVGLIIQDCVTFC